MPLLALKILTDVEGTLPERLTVARAAVAPRPALTSAPRPGSS
ncbi:hypothetical protein [Phytomonospora endophytica]|uniref:Uncharacterized protein n=1 Tax=Phytomonospora endophytica TaxID=714109 RepID=A0A841FE31_9ACTN|nr:hypothetical protein [Phytomonospora endophytica]MBB6034084.1 hypothetical protein [Phytomonospora endophytica]